MSEPQLSEGRTAPGEASALIVLDGIRHNYGTREVLKGLNLRVDQGKIVALLGPNGSGKSTLISLLTGMIPKQIGTMKFLGRDISPDSWEFRAELGVVFQQPSLDVKLSALENLELHASLRGIRGAEAKRRIAEILDFIGLADRAGEVVGKWSGGMRRRLDIARALLPRPSLLIMDEPTTGLDEASFRALWTHLEYTNRTEGLTVLFSTHRAEEAERAHEIAIMHQGVMVSHSTPSALRAQLEDDWIVIRSTDVPRTLECLGSFADLSVNAARDTVSVGCKRGPELLPRLLAALPAEIVQSVELRRPDLADAFLKMTGQSLDEDLSGER